LIRVHVEAEQHARACSQIYASHGRQEAGKRNKSRSLGKIYPPKKFPTDLLPIMPSYCECIKELIDKVRALRIQSLLKSPLAGNHTSNT
jgi:hypothetical protein